MAADEVPTPPPEDPAATVAREDRERPRAVAAAIVAGTLPLVAYAFLTAVSSDAPSGARRGMLFRDEHSTELVAAAALLGVGALAVGWTSLFLFRAAKRRRPDVPAAARVCAIAGPVLLLLGNTAAELILAVESHDFATSAIEAQTNEAAKEIFRLTEVQVAAYAGLAGQLATAFALLLVALNAMRVGLLTRFMGALGMITGALVVIRIGPFPIVQFFWFGALAFLFAGRWPNGMPPAWASGEAVPWPSQQEIREQRERERDAERSQPEPDTGSDRGRDLEPAAVAADGPAHSASKKRKRKRRR